MRSLTLFLIFTAAACKAFDPLSGPTGPHIRITGVTITPTQVRAGDLFTVFVNITFGDCAPAATTSS